MNEKQFVAALEPYLEELTATISRVKALEEKPGPNIDAAIQAFVEKHADELRGEPGADGVAPTLEEVIGALMQQYAPDIKGEPGKDGEPGTDGQPGADGEPGADGKDADPDQVAEALKSDESFLQAVRGKDGEPGKDGADGKDAPAVDPSEVAAALKSDQAFVTTLVGPPGTDGERGEAGADGAGLTTPMHVVGKVYREGTSVMAYLGQYFRAKCDTAGVPGDSEDWERIGTAGFRWRGLKPEEKSLSQGDIFIDDGSMFAVFDDVPKMVVQRPKPAPRVTSATVRDHKLVIKMSNGEEVSCALPEVRDPSKALEEVQAKMAELDEALRRAEKSLRLANEVIAKLSQAVVDLGGEL